MKKPTVRVTNKMRNSIAGYGFISLWFIGLIVFTLFPLGQAIWYSFNIAEFKGSGIQTTFNGFKNFVYAFTEDSTFPQMLVTYLSSIIVQVPFSVTASLIISMLLNQNIKGRGMWRVIFFLPVIISTGPVITELMGQGATSLPMIGGKDLDIFLADFLPGFIAKPIGLLFDNLIIVLWYTGIPTLIFLSGLQRIDKSTYEAASIDGASPWQCFWKITLPSMKSFIFVNVVYTIVTLSFSDIPAGDNQLNILQYMQRHMIEASGKGYGYACSLGLIYFAVILLQIVIYSLFLAPRKGNR